MLSMTPLRVLSSTAEAFAARDRKQNHVGRQATPTTHCRKQASPVRSPRHVEDREERQRQGFFVYNPFILPAASVGASTGRKRHREETEADSESEESHRARSRDSSGSRSPKQKEKSRHRRRDGGGERRARAVSPSLQVKKVDPGPGTKFAEAAIQDQAAVGQHPNPRRYLLFEALVKRKKVIPLPGRPGAPIDVSYYPGCELLTDDEFEVCSVLRLTPQQYFASRRTLVENHRRLGFYRKSAAQKMLKIDVNKTGKLYDFFQENGWMPKHESDTDYHDPEDVEI